MAIYQEILTKEGTETQRLTPMKAIRHKCLECRYWSSQEVSECASANCALLAFRFGKRPNAKFESEIEAKQIQIQLPFEFEEGGKGTQL
jgi:hypothetical protein